MDINLLIANQLAHSNDNPALSLNKTNGMIVGKKGDQKGNDLLEVIHAVKEALEREKPLGLRVTKLPLEEIQEYFEDRVNQLEKQRYEKMSIYGAGNSKDNGLDNAIRALSKVIAQKKIHSGQSPQNPISNEDLATEGG